MDIIKGVIDKVASRKLAVTAAAGAAAVTGMVEITMPVAIVAAAYIMGQSKAGQGGVPSPIRTISPPASTSPPPKPLRYPSYPPHPRPR
jgi:hypothetical protein